MRRRILGGMGPATAAFVAFVSLPGRGGAQVQRVPLNPQSQRVLNVTGAFEQRSLRGLALDGIAVVGEIVGDELLEKATFDSVVAATRVTPPQLEAVFAEALQPHGRKVLPTERWDGRQPILKIKLEFGPGTTGKGPYMGLVKVALAQPVVLGRELRTLNAPPVKLGNVQLKPVAFDTTGVLLAETWHTQQPFNTTNPRSILPMVRQLVGRFLNEHGGANPGATASGG